MTNVCAACDGQHLLLQGISAALKERMQHAASGKGPAERPMLLFPEVLTGLLY